MSHTEEKTTWEEPEVILESQSPVCEIQAFVEKSDTCYYLYLWINFMSEEPQMRTCWICNRVKAPDTLDVAAMENGRAPAMPAEYVAHAPVGMELNEAKLSIVWLEEGDAAALLYEEEIICVVPGWSGYNGFCGYSKYAKGMGPYAWELTQALPVLSARVQQSQQFWDYFDTDYWPAVQDMHCKTLEAFFGKYERYFAIDGGEFPPKALLMGSAQNVAYAITAGVSMIPMPKAEQYYGEENKYFRRIELGFATSMQHKKLCEHMGSTISALAAMPWREITFLGHGHTIPFSNIKGFAAILFVNPKLIAGMEVPSYEQFMEEDINLLWMIPITQEEYDFVMQRDVEALLASSADTSQLHVFDGSRKFV